VGIIGRSQPVFGGKRWRDLLNEPSLRSGFTCRMTRLLKQKVIHVGGLPRDLLATHKKVGGDEKKKYYRDHTVHGEEGGVEFG
jgi:hypothetical protein